MDKGKFSGERKRGLWETISRVRMGKKWERAFGQGGV